MSRRLALALALALAPTAPALAQSDDDAPVPYDDDGSSRAREDSSSDDSDADSDLPKKKKHKKSKRQRRDDDFRVVDDEAAAQEETLAHVDDPNLGVGGELVSGAMLLESSRGALADPRFVIGARFTWEYGRLIPDEVLREVFFVDLGWSYASTKDGTKNLSSEFHSHDLALAPGFALPFGAKSPMSGYAQVGVGINYGLSVLHIEGKDTTLSGTKLLVQYGVGLRGRFSLVDDGSLKLAVRLELTRYVRGYMHDTLLALGAGLIF